MCWCYCLPAARPVWNLGYVQVAAGHLAVRRGRRQLSTHVCRAWWECRGCHRRASTHTATVQHQEPGCHRDSGLLQIVFPSFTGYICQSIMELTCQSRSFLQELRLHFWLSNTRVRIVCSHKITSSESFIKA